MTVALEHPQEQGVLLHDMSWDFYERLLEEVGDRHVFITYDRGKLEIMSPSWKHERYAERVAMVIRIVASELKLPIVSGASTTFRSKSSEAGLEPDHCFYFQNVRAVGWPNESRSIDASACQRSGSKTAKDYASCASLELNTFPQARVTRSPSFRPRRFTSLLNEARQPTREPGSAPYRTGFGRI